MFVLCVCVCFLVGSESYPNFLFGDELSVEQAMVCSEGRRDALQLTLLPSIRPRHFLSGGDADACVLSEGTLRSWESIGDVCRRIQTLILASLSLGVVVAPLEAGRSNKKVGGPSEPDEGTRCRVAIGRQ